jgi:Ca2+-binding RTX toxin-like protein
MSINYVGLLVGGSVYSEYLSAGQVDAYTLNLIGGVTYYLDVTAATIPLDIAVAEPGGVVNGEWTVGAGQTITYTAPVTGTYGAGVDTSTFGAGSYTITGGNAWVNLTDTSTHASSNPFMTPYSGPVAGLAEQFIDLNPHNLNITATTPNVFLHSGSGEDALQVLSGNNVLDGSTGSNFLVGGSGHDTFFVDDRSAPSAIWSTLVNFHAGDVATVWGVTPAAFNLAWVNGQGATGYTGLTLGATAAGHPNANMTITGYTTADLSNGRLTVAYGVDLGSGSSFMMVTGH